MKEIIMRAKSQEAKKRESLQVESGGDRGEGLRRNGRRGGIMDMHASIEKLSFSTIWKTYSKVEINRNEIPQKQMDLDSRRRVNPFNYLGQFSPDFVRVLLDKYAPDNCALLDPFMGAGTTIFEGLKLGMDSFGSEINPAGIEMAKLVEFFEIPISERKKICGEAILSADTIGQPEQQKMSEPTSELEGSPRDSLPSRVLWFLSRENLEGPEGGLLINGLVEYMSRNSPFDAEYTDCVKRYVDLVLDFPEVNRKWGVFHCDARTITLSNNSINLVFTSPPHINVHNYHQHHRKFMEKLGWDVLEVERSESGSNRKHRQNRFLTVIQYVLDLSQVFRELARVLDESGRMIFVVGRSSTVRGVKFDNGRILAGDGRLSGFEFVKRQERKYTNNFGTLLFEDILHFRPSQKRNLKGEQINPHEFARGVLQEALHLSKDKSVRRDMLDAINGDPPQPSPIFFPSNAFKQGKGKG